MTKQNNTSMKKFTVGQTVHVFEPKGARNLKGGMQTSERTGGEADDVDPSEDLTVLKTFGSTKALCRREDGSEITVHINHINNDSPYYAQRGQAAQKLTPDQKVAAAQAKVEAALREAEQAKLEQEAAELASLELDEVAHG